MLLDIQSQHPMNNNNGNLIVAVHNGHLQHTSPNPKKSLVATGGSYLHKPQQQS
jgi:hypothetical protein